MNWWFTRPGLADCIRDQLGGAVLPLKCCTGGGVEGHANASATERHGKVRGPIKANNLGRLSRYQARPTRAA